MVKAVAYLIVADVASATFICIDKYKDNPRITGDK